jgi:hypothetical protein
VGRYRGRLGGHEGYAARKLSDGTFSSGYEEPVAFVAYVAACAHNGSAHAPHWYGPNEYPPTTEGEKAAVDEWEDLHARHLLTSPEHADVTRHVNALLVRLDTLVAESPAAMLSELRRVQSRTGALLTTAVTHARGLGTSWPAIAAALGTSEQAAREEFDGRGPGGSS